MKRKTDVAINQELLKENYIADLFRRYMKAQNMKFSDVGNTINCSAGNVYRIMDKSADDMTIKQIFTLGKAVNCPKEKIVKAFEMQYDEWVNHSES